MSTHVAVKLKTGREMVIPVDACELWHCPVAKDDDMREAWACNGLGITEEEYNRLKALLTTEPVYFCEVEVCQECGRKMDNGVCEWCEARKDRNNDN